MYGMLTHLYIIMCNILVYSVQYTHAPTGVSTEAYSS